MSSGESLLPIPTRYTRSIHLLRDFANDRVGVHDYQVTPLVLQTTDRVMEGLALDATARAFSLIGPYGSGKSAFGVFLAHYLRSTPNARRRLVAEHSADGTAAALVYDGPQLLPVLVSGNNESLRRAILQGMLRTFEAMKPLRDGRLWLPAALADAAADPEIDPQRVADLVAEACTVVQNRTAFHGLLLIVDELGQFLDFASRQADERDLFVLQTLAEMAARSGGTPCVVLTILHQSFDRYAATAGATRRIEWAKVQGRFIDLPFQEPPAQMLRMVGQALCPATGDPFATLRQPWAAEVAPLGERLGLRPADISADEWQQLVARAYPLHPTVLVALPLLFRQLAQNERSLFAFLSSYEPWSVQDVLRSAASTDASEARVYRLTHLYAYVQATLGAGLFGRARGQRWAELAEALTLLPQQTGLLADVLTIIGVLGALGQGRGVRASRGQIAFALLGLYDGTEVEQALNELDDRKHISYRQHRDSFVVWEGSDLDIDQLTQEAKREIGDRYPLVKLLEQHVDSAPLVARRHSYQSGAVRYFAVRFVDGDDLAAVQPVPHEADGEILYVVPADDEALVAAQEWAAQSAQAADRQRMVVLPRRVQELRDLLMDVAALERVLTQRPELENDRAARREVSSRLAEAQSALAQTITETYGPGLSRWYWCGREVAARTAREVDELLSQACDETYHATPRIWNELIVRRQLSSAAAKARRNLIEAMVDHSYEEALGLQGYPPERAIYESVLRGSGLHRRDPDGVWRFGPPPASDPLRLQPTWDALDQFFTSSETAALPIVGLYEQLQEPPLGVKAGLVPLLFMAAYCAHAGEIALYEHGSYVPMPDIATFERLLRQPNYFALRRSRTTGMRVAVYERLARALAPRALAQPVQPAMFDAVTPLMRVLSTLPAYAKTTRTISPTAQHIRQALIDARAPDELLFAQLPEACGLAPFDPDQLAADELLDQFFGRLREGLQELQNAYPTLIDRVRDRIRAAFGATATTSADLRAELVERFSEIAAVISDSQLRALGVRLEHAEDGNAWIESAAALVARKPPDAWTDADAASFDLHIADLGRRFKVAEQMAIVNQALIPIRTIVNRIVVFGSIARFTQWLNVVDRSRALFTDGHDMIRC